jgi:hypothetical protein
VINMNSPEPGAIAMRIKEAQEEQKATELAQARERERERERVRDNKTYERNLLASFDAVVARINARLAEPLIRSLATARDKEYRFGARCVYVHFFDDAEKCYVLSTSFMGDSLRSERTAKIGRVGISSSCAHLETPASGESSRREFQRWYRVEHVLNP